MNQVVKHKIICKELNKTYEKKNHDYGNSFGNTFEKLGVISALTRITDKYNRLVSLCTMSDDQRMVEDETISDTLLDLANYCIMTEMELRREKEENNTQNKVVIPTQKRKKHVVKKSTKHDERKDSMKEMVLDEM